MPSPNPNLLNANLMVLRDARARVLSDDVFVQIAELAQLKFKSGVARSLHFSEPVPNRNKPLPSPVQDRHARNHLALTEGAAARFNSLTAVFSRATRIAVGAWQMHQNKNLESGSDAATGFQRDETRPRRMMRM